MYISIREFIYVSVDSIFETAQHYYPSLDIYLSCVQRPHVLRESHTLKKNDTRT